MGAWQTFEREGKGNWGARPRARETPAPTLLPRGRTFALLTGPIFPFHFERAPRRLSIIWLKVGIV